MPAFSPEVLADPFGVILGLVQASDPELAPGTVEELVSKIAPGRSVRRRLAQGLVDRPAVLCDGQSPAPRVVGELLVVLASHSGAISPPRCADCHKALRSFHRRGEDWCCSVCGTTRVECAICRRPARVAARDRAGRPRCSSCLPDGPDPVAIVLEVLRRLEPSLDADTVRFAFEAVTSRAGQRRQLAWALEDRPELLCGAGAEAPTPSVLGFIDALVEAGATRIVRPACPRCHRVVRLSQVREGLRICRGCEARLRAVPCTRCAAVRDPITRDESGGPVCANCFMKEPSNQEDCLRCRRRRPVSVRTPEGPLCPSCRPVAEMTCSICGRVAPCEIAKATGEPWCRACQKRWARCASCGELRPVRGGSTDAPLCARCTRGDRSFWKSCPECGEQTKLTDGLCVRCSLRGRLRELLAGGDGAIRPELVALFENLAAVDRPATVLGWLARSDAVAVLGKIGSGEVTLNHDALDALSAGKPLEHLRAVLVSTGALPPRDEQMARLEAWVASTIAARSDPDERRLLQRYALWHLLRRLRRRVGSTGTTCSQTTLLKRRVRVAIMLLDWLESREVDLASADQGHLDAWLTTEGSTKRDDAGHFVRWAAGERLTRLELPAARWTGPTSVLDSEGRFAKARWLLSEHALDRADRVAGLLVLLYAQRAATISRLRLDHVEINEGTVRLHLGAHPVVLPEPLAGIVVELVGDRRGHATLGDVGTSPWLFPGGRPGRPISASRLAERLRALGIQAGPVRSSALMQLAGELPAAVIARMLGVHIKVAVEWQRAASGDWTTYAAEYSRRASGQRPGVNQS